VETLAEPGAVFVSNTVYEHVRDRLSFAFDDLGEQQVKNIARPVHVYRVREARRGGGGARGTLGEHVRPHLARPGLAN